MKLAWTTILYNEEKTVERTIRSLASVIDGAVIGIDRKTTDNTKRVVETMLHHLMKDIVFYEFDLNGDYSSARNIGLEIAEKGGYDYIFVLDGDEYLKEESVEPLIELKGDRFAIPYNCILSTMIGHDVEKRFLMSAPTCRIFKSKYRYIFKVHETVNSPNDKGVLWMPGIVTMNDKHPEDRKTSNTKLRIESLHEDLRNFPRSSDRMFNLAMEYSSDGDFKNAVHWMENAIDNDLAESMRYMAHLKLARFYSQLNRNVDQYNILRECVVKFPTRGEHIVELAKYHLERNDLFAAAHYLFSACNMSKPTTSEMYIDHYYTWVPWRLLYEWCRQIGWELGLKETKMVIEKAFPEIVGEL